MRRFPFSMDKYFLGSFCLCWIERESGERHEVVSKTEKPFLMETEFAVLKKIAVWTRIGGKFFSRNRKVFLYRKDF